MKLAMVTTERENKREREKKERESVIGFLAKG